MWLRPSALAVPISVLGGADAVRSEDAGNYQEL